MAIFNGPASAIEDNRNKVNEINERSTEHQYPSALALYRLQHQTKSYVNDNFANAIKGTASGETAFLTDVSPLQHNINVVVDNAEAKIIRSGKNMLDLSTTIPTLNNGSKYVVNGNSFTMKGNVGGSDHNYDAGQILLPTNGKINEIGTPVKKGKIYTVSFDYLLIEKGQRDNSIGLYIYIPNGQFNSVIATFAGVVGVTKRLSYTFTATKDTKIGLGFRVNNNYVTISNIQIEEGNKATDFEDYVEPVEYIPSNDGSLSVPSLCPTTVLTTDTEGVIINAEYNKDTNKVINNLINAVISLGGNV